MAVSENGMSLLTTAPPAQQVAGTNVFLRVRPGVVGWILLYFAARFDAEVEDIDQAAGHPIDDASWNYRYVAGSTVYSNHASASALDLNWNRHPRGVRNTFTPSQVAAIRRIQADCSGIIRWGGDYKSPSIVDDMHFEVYGNDANIHAAWDAIRSKQLMSAEIHKPKDIDMITVELPARFAYDENQRLVDKTALVHLTGEWTGNSWLGNLRASAVLSCHWTIDPKVALIRPEFGVTDSAGKQQWIPQPVVTLKHFAEAVWLHMDGGKYAVSAGFVKNDFDFSVPVTLGLMYAAQ